MSLWVFFMNILMRNNIHNFRNIQNLVIRKVFKKNIVIICYFLKDWKPNNNNKYIQSHWRYIIAGSLDYGQKCCSNITNNATIIDQLSNLNVVQMNGMEWKEKNIWKICKIRYKKLKMDQIFNDKNLYISKILFIKNINSKLNLLLM